MDAFDNFLTGTITLFSDPLGILIFFGGVVGGMLFGAIPGVSMLTLAAILLPFTAHLSPEHGIMLFSVIYCTGVYGGAITAILFNIPGAPENAPTAFDGYPMTLNGEAGKAVGAAVMCSAIGGVVSCVAVIEPRSIVGALESLVATVCTAFDTSDAPTTPTVCDGETRRDLLREV